MQGFPLEEYLEALLHCLSMEGIPDIMLLSATCIGHLLDMFPGGTRVLVHHGALPILVYKVQNIQYIDVAEHSIKILHRLLHLPENAIPLLKLDVFAILTNFIDFFVSSVQKQIIEILIKLILPIKEIDQLDAFILPNLPALKNYLMHSQERSTKFCMIYANILDKVVKLIEDNEAKKQAYIIALIDREVLQRNLGTFEEMLSDGLPQESLGQAESMVKMFKKSCYYNLDYFEFCLEQGIIDLLDRCLQRLSEQVVSEDASSSLYLLIEIFFFFNSVLALKVKNDNLIILTAPHYGLKIVENILVPERQALFDANRHYYRAIIKTVFTRVPIFYEKVNHTFLKYILLIIVEKIFSFSEKDEILALLKMSDEPNSFLIFYSQLLQEPDMMIIILVMLIVQALMRKEISSIYHIIQREGINTFLTDVSSHNSLSQISVTQSAKKKSKKPEKKIAEKVSKLEEFIKKQEASPANKMGIKKQDSDSLEEVRRETRKLAQSLLNKYSEQAQDGYEEVDATLSALGTHLNRRLDTSLFSDEVDYGKSVYEGLKSLYSKFGTITSYEYERHGIYSSLFTYLTSDSTVAQRVHCFVTEMYKDNSIHELVRSLQKSNGQTRTQWKKVQEKAVQGNLKQSLRFLTQRAKFKVKFVEKPEEEEAKATMDLIRKEFAGQINSSINSIKMQNIREMEQGFLSQQQGLFDYKVKFFTEIPVFVMSLEQFGTLESIEEYLLNKLEGKGDLDYQGIFNHYVKSLKQNQKKNELEKLKQVQTQENQIRGQSGKEGEEEEEGDEEQLEVEEVEQAQKKIMTASKEETIWDNTVKRKMSQQESKIDLMDQMRKDKLQIGDYLEVRFSINREAVQKKATVYELTQKYQKDEQLLIEFSLHKKTQEYQPSENTPEKKEEETGHRSILNRLTGTRQSSDPALSLMRVVSCINTEMPWFFGESSSLSCLWGGEGQLDMHLQMKRQLVSKQLVNEKLCQEAKARWTNTLLMTGKSTAEWTSSQEERLYTHGDKFLYDLESRIAYFQHVSQSTYRALYYLCQHNRDKVKEMESTKIGKLKRKKIKFHRENLLQSAIKSLCSDKADRERETVLEFEFQGEEGSGLGPTLEFYTLMAQGLLDTSLLRSCPDGTWFPKPCGPEGDKMGVFGLMGQMVARGILDERVVDLPLSPIWWKLVMGHTVSLQDLQEIDPALCTFMLDMQTLANRKARGEASSTLLYKSCPLSDLGIYLTLPGYDSIALVPDGQDILLSAENVETYVSQVAYSLFQRSLAPLLAAFRRGFGYLIPLERLHCFYPWEISKLYIGEGDPALWSFDEIRTNITAAHGYHENSVQIVHLVKILSSFSPAEQRSFLQFITGCPRLPMGGFKRLHPRLTVVKRTVENSSTDQTLPSVMTCQNYLKMPEYSSEETMRQRLLYVMQEGQGSFSLS